MTITKAKMTAILCAAALAAGTVGYLAVKDTNPLAQGSIITGWSSEGGNPQNKDNLQDRMYLIEQGDTITFSITAGGSEAYEWQVNKVVQSAGGDSLVWTVPDEKGIWEIHVKVTAASDEEHMEWVISTLSNDEAPDMLDYFTDGAYSGRTETDPWARPLPEWENSYHSLDPSKKMLSTGDSIDDGAIKTDSTVAYGTWKIRYYYPKYKIAGTEARIRYRYMWLGEYLFDSSMRAGSHTGFSGGQAHWNPIGGPDAPLGGECDAGFMTTGGKEPEDPQDWHEVTIIRTPDNEIYQFTDGIAHFKVWNGDYDSCSRMRLRIERERGNYSEGLVGFADCVEVYEGRYLFPNAGISYNQYIDNWKWNAATDLWEAVYRDGIVVGRGPNGQTATLQGIADAINNASLFEYDPATRTAICHTDLVVADFSALKLENETLKMDCGSSGEHQISLLWGANLEIDGSTITTTNDNYFLWRLTSTSHFGYPALFQTGRPGRQPGGLVHPSFQVLRFNNSVIDNCAYLFIESPFELKVTATQFTRIHETDIGEYSFGCRGGTHVYDGTLRKEFVRGDKGFWILAHSFDMRDLQMDDVSISPASGAGPLDLTFILSDDRRIITLRNFDAADQNLIVRKSRMMLSYWFNDLGKEYNATLCFVNGRFGNISVPTDKAWAVPKYYLDVKVVDQHGSPVEGAEVTVANEVDDDGFPAENMVGRYVPTETLDIRNLNLYTVYPYTPYSPLRTTTTTGSGHTPPPSVTANTMILPDFVQDENGAQEFTYTITVEKDGKQKVVTGVNPGPGWYRPDPNAPTHTITVVLDADAAVVGRGVFYNNSAFDGNDPAAGAADDGAIAPDKTALLPGGTATFANYTSYSRGINGVMVDIASLPGAPTAADFTFKVGNDNAPASWTAAPAPTSITVRNGAGVDGTDRITIIWSDNAIEKQWLQVAVKATAATGLSVDDVFYFGNAIGETGNSATDARVTPTDQVNTRNNPHTLGHDPAGIDDAYDFNRDRKVGPTDEIIARDNGTNSSTALKLITVP